MQRALGMRGSAGAPTRRWIIGWLAVCALPGTPRRDLYLIRAYEYPEEWDGLSQPELHGRLVNIRLQLRETGRRPLPRRRQVQPLSRAQMDAEGRDQAEHHAREPGRQADDEDRLHADEENMLADFVELKRGLESEQKAPHEK